MEKLSFTRCLFCEKEYRPNEGNTKIYGPYVEVTCPYCGRVFEGKLLNLVDRLSRDPNNRLKGAARMQQMAQLIEKNSVTDANKGKPGKEKKKPKKDKKEKK